MTDTPAPAAIPRPTPAPTHFTPPHPGHTVTLYDRQYLQGAQRAIDAATHRIRVAEFIVYPGSSVNRLLDSLIDAAQRGVQIQVMMDEESSSTEGVLQDLAAAGIHTRFDAYDRTLHNKLIIADDVVVLGSHNLTDAAFDRNHEGSIKVVDREIAAWYSAWFDAVWDHPGDDPMIPALDRTDLFPIADRGITDALIHCIDSSNHSVDIVMYAIAWNNNYPGSAVDRVLRSIEAAAERGVQVGVVLDGSIWVVEHDINTAAIERLQHSDLQLWIAEPQVTTHAKVLRCDDTVILSDANWSYSGLERMHGTSLGFRDANLLTETLHWMKQIQLQAHPL